MRSGGSGPGFAGKELGNQPGRLQRAPPQRPGQEKLSKQQPCRFHHLPQVPTSRQGTAARGRHAAPDTITQAMEQQKCTRGEGNP